MLTDDLREQLFKIEAEAVGRCQKTTEYREAVNK